MKLILKIIVSKMTVSVTNSLIIFLFETKIAKVYFKKFKKLIINYLWMFTIIVFYIKI
jgi:hypothetical protein